jgi:GrpB-like predicted nucleotidyltransferase (UPF0157 family)
MLGLQRKSVRLDSYDPDWVKFFEKEKDSFKKVLGDKFIAAEHIGSTAIPGIKAKPILDLMLAIDSLDDWEWLRPLLNQLNYGFRQDYRKNQEHILFVKGPENNRTHYLKVAEFNSDFWREHIIFRDYLIQNPVLRLKYQSLKEDLAKTHPDDRAFYTMGKAKFIKNVLEQTGYQGRIL